MNTSQITQRRSVAAFAAALCFQLLARDAHAETDRVVAWTDRGAVSGLATATGSKFLGIPYAAPPVGELRFRPPQPHARWRETRSASEFGSACPQPSSDPNAPPRSESCLFLNVYTPAAHPSRDPRRYPVMVYFHGGGLMTGSGSGVDPGPLVERGTVVVTINYRLGALGLLAHPALTRESPDAASGNYALMDQQQALRWVRANIAQFAGDPRNVTIFGNSAGGVSVLAQLVSPLAAGLFHGAISQSGTYNLVQRSLAEAEAEGEVIATAAGCPGQDTACLRGLSADVIVASQGTPRGEFVPIVDGLVLAQSLRPALSRGEFNRVPVLVGTTHDEMSLYIALLVELVRGPVPPENYPAAVAAALQLPEAAVPSVIAQYPLTSYLNPGQALSALTTDALFACNARLTAQLLAQYVPVFAYEFDDADAPSYGPIVSFPYGATHGSDLQYLFATYPGQVNPPAFDADQARLSDTMIRYWTKFARTQTPNGFGTPPWRRYDTTRELVQLLTPPRPEPYSGFAADHKCAFWTAFGG